MDEATAKVLAETWSDGSSDGNERIVYLFRAALPEELGGEVDATPYNAEEILFPPSVSRGDVEPADVEIVRARLAACAPEALRLLLEAETADNSDGEYTPRCPWCENRSFSAEVPGEAGRRFVSHASTHAPDCNWLALMKKVGIR